MRNILDSNIWTIVSVIIIGLLVYFVYGESPSRIHYDAPWMRVGILIFIGVFVGILGLFVMAYVPVKWEEMSRLPFRVSHCLIVLVLLCALSVLEPYIIDMIFGD